MWSNARLTHIFFLVLSFLKLPAIHAAPVTTAAQGVQYLQQFGYISPDTSQGPPPISDVSYALEAFQTFAKIDVTGEFDDATKAAMSGPRCGSPDVFITTNNINPRRQRRYMATQGWDHTHITYNIVRYTEQLPGEIILDTVHRAFKVWADATILTFERKTDGTADIMISFFPSFQDHGDGQPFDGPGQVLAHANYPWVSKSPGDIHLDDAEEWTVGANGGQNLWNILVHEIGHSLGLGHSMYTPAVMYPFYVGYKEELELHQDDIGGIVHLYGNGMTTPPNTATPEPRGANNPNVPNLCSVYMDAIVPSDDGLLVFKDSYYWIFGENGVKPGYPRLLSQGWPGLQSKFHSAVYRKNDNIEPNNSGSIVFYKGRVVWSYNGKNLDKGYPKDITSVYEVHRSNLNSPLAVAELGTNGETYFFTSDQEVYIHNWLNVIQGPFQVSEVFAGVSGDIISAYEGQDQYLYLFEKQGNFYKIDPFGLQTLSGYPRSWQEPKAGHEDFFGCSTEFVSGRGRSLLPNVHLIITYISFIFIVTCLT